MRHRLIPLGVVALALALTGAARADGGEDEVTLKNGGIVRGTVVSSEPGTSVKIIELGSTQARVIPWSQVSDVERGKYAPARPEQPGPAGPGYGMMAPPPLEPPAPRVGTSGVVRLHIESPLPAQLIEQGGTAIGTYGGYGVMIEELRPVCMSPCDRVVDGSQGQAFTLNGDFSPPRPFHFVGQTGDLTLRVQPGSLGRRIGGAWATILGGSVLLAGAVMLPIALASHADIYTGVSTHNGALVGVGAGMLAVGGVSLVAGIVMLATSSTKVRMELGAGRQEGAARPRYWLGEF